MTYKFTPYILFGVISALFLTVWTPDVLAFNKDIDEVTKHIRSQSNPTANIVAGMAFLTGLFFVFGGINKLRKPDSSNERGNPQVYGVIAIVVGGLLTTVGTTAFVFKDTLYDTNSNTQAERNANFKVEGDGKNHLLEFAGE